MGIVVIILSVLAFLSIIVTVLAYIGLKVKKQEKKIKHQWEVQSRKKKSKKWSRKSTPKVPTIN